MEQVGIMRQVMTGGCERSSEGNVKGGGGDGKIRKSLIQRWREDDSSFALSLGATSRDKVQKAAVGAAKERG